MGFNVVEIANINDYRFYFYTRLSNSMKTKTSYKTAKYTCIC